MRTRVNANMGASVPAAMPGPAHLADHSQLPRKAQEQGPHSRYTEMASFNFPHIQLASLDEITEDASHPPADDKLCKTVK